MHGRTLDIAYWSCGGAAVTIAALPSIVLLLNGIAFIATGAYGFLYPVALAKLAGFSFDAPIAVSEFWANYGGLYLFYGLYLGWCAFVPERQRGALTVLLFTSMGLATGRLLGLSIADPGQAQLSFLVWELITAALCLVVMRRQTR